MSGDVMPAMVAELDSRDRLLVQAWHSLGCDWNQACVNAGVLAPDGRLMAEQTPACIELQDSAPRLHEPGDHAGFAHAGLSPLGEVNSVKLGAGGSNDERRRS